VLGSRVLTATATELTSFTAEFVSIESSVFVQATGHKNDRPRIPTPTDLFISTMLAVQDALIVNWSSYVQDIARRDHQRQALAEFHTRLPSEFLTSQGIVQDVYRHVENDARSPEAVARTSDYP